MSSPQLQKDRWGVLKKKEPFLRGHQKKMEKEEKKQIVEKIKTVVVEKQTGFSFDEMMAMAKLIGSEMAKEMVAATQEQTDKLAEKLDNIEVKGGVVTVEGSAPTSTKSYDEVEMDDSIVDFSKEKEFTTNVTIGETKVESGAAAKKKASKLAALLGKK